MLKATEDVEYNVLYEAKDPEGETLVWSLTTNADWLAVDSTTGLLHGVPNNTHVRRWWVNVSCSDTAGNVAFHQFTLTVINTPPEIITEDVLTAIEDELYYVDYNSTDDGQGVKWSLSTDASWLSIDPDTGILEGTPTDADVGFYTVNISCDDGHKGLAYHEFTLIVINRPPEIITKPVETATEDQLYRVDYEASEEVRWDISTNASWLTLDARTGRLAGTPNNKNVRTYGVSISCMDFHGGTTYQNFTLTVQGVNDAPVFVDAPRELTISAKKPTTINFSIYVQDVDNATEELVLSVDSRYVKIKGLLATFRYPPEVTTDIVTFTISDGLANATHLIKINVITDTDGDGVPDYMDEDDDNDGMPDDYENESPQLNSTVPDANADPDGDGLPNYVEYILDSDPGLKDSDSDGIPDGWEYKHGLNVTGNDSVEDPDNDKYTNLEEYNAGRDPQNAKSRPGLVEPGQLETQKNLLNLTIGIAVVIIIIVVVVAVWYIRKLKKLQK